MKFTPKKVRDQAIKFRKKVEGHLMDVVEILTRNDRDNIKVEALHAINQMFNRNEGDMAFRPLGRMSRKFLEVEIETMSDIWLPQEDREEMAIAENHFRRNPSSGVSRGSRMNSSFPLPVDPAPATTAEEAIKLVQSGKYKWVTKNGIMCLASTEERPKLRVIGEAVSVTRL